MKRFLSLIIVPLVAFVVTFAVVRLAYSDTGSGSGSAVSAISGDSGSGLGSQVVPGGSGSGLASTPADKLADPIKAPLATIDDLKQAKSQGWAMLILVALIAVAKALAFVPGAVGKWFATGRQGMVLAGSLALAVAMYNVVALGGSWYAAGFAALTALVGMLSPKAPVAAREKAGTA